MTLIADQPDTQTVVDQLISQKATAIAATAWEGYLSCGRGCLMTDGRSVAYIPRAAITRQFPGLTADRKRLLRAVDGYDPCAEVVLILSWADGSWTIRRYTPTTTPEAALLCRVGTPGMPSMQASYGSWGLDGIAMMPADR
jgi:hypothetical protein